MHSRISSHSHHVLAGAPLPDSLVCSLARFCCSPGLSVDAGFLTAIRTLTMEWTVPSAASFYVPTLPGLVQDEENPLRMFSGHIPSDPDAAVLPPTTVYAHTFFFMIRARRRADKERILFWFNVRSLYSRGHSVADCRTCVAGRPWVFIF